MADSISFQLQGIDSLLNKFASISDEVKKKGGRSSLRKAANLIAEKARQNARAIDDPETPASIPNNIAVRWNGRLNKRTGDLGFRVGVLGGAQPQPGNVGYWRFLEFGTETSIAKPFMRPALANNINEATSVFLREYEKAIDRAIKRAAKGKS